MPIFKQGQAVAAKNLCWATSAMSEGEFVKENLEFLRDAANEITRALM